MYLTISSIQDALVYNLRDPSLWYQDAACTTPFTTTGQQVKGVKNAAGSIIITGGTDAYTGSLTGWTDGGPCLVSDGTQIMAIAAPFGAVEEQGLSIYAVTSGGGAANGSVQAVWGFQGCNATFYRDGADNYNLFTTVAGEVRSTEQPANVLPQVSSFRWNGADTSCATVDNLSHRDLHIQFSSYSFGNRKNEYGGRQNLGVTGHDMRLGTNFVGSNYFVGKTAYLVLVKRFTLEDEDNTIIDVLCKTCAIASAPYVMWVGDSRVAGQNLNTGESAPEHLRVLSPSWVVENDARSGRTSPEFSNQCYRGFAWRFLPNACSGQQCIVWGLGTNDPGNQSSPADTIGVWLNAVQLAVKLTGGQVPFVFTTIYARGDTNVDANQIPLQNFIRANYRTLAPMGYLCDLAADPRLSDPNNTTYFQNDKLHPTAAGCAVMAELVYPIAVQAIAAAALRFATGFNPGVTLAASQPYYAPAVAGNAMTLTSVYDPAKVAASASSLATVANTTASTLTALNTLSVNSPTNESIAETMLAATTAGGDTVDQALSRAKDLTTTINTHTDTVASSLTTSVNAIPAAITSAHGAGPYNGAGGVGDTAVNHNTGGTDNLRFEFGTGSSAAGLDGADVRAYLAADYAAGNYAAAYIKGQTITGPVGGVSGRMPNPMFLQSGNSYVIVFNKPGFVGSTTASIAI